MRPAPDTPTHQPYPPQSGAASASDAERDHEAANDRWNNGACDGARGRKPQSDDADYLEGHAHGLDSRKVRVVMPSRPEGYYHAPVGTFD